MGNRRQQERCLFLFSVQAQTASDWMDKDAKFKPSDVISEVMFLFVIIFSTRPAMPRNAQLDSAGRLFLNELLENPKERGELLAAAQEQFPAEQPRGGAELTKKQRQWLVQQV